jgi:hypothetical protein
MMPKSQMMLCFFSCQASIVDEFLLINRELQNDLFTFHNAGWYDVQTMRSGAWGNSAFSKNSFCQALQRKGMCRNVLQHVAECPKSWQSTTKSCRMFYRMPKELAKHLTIIFKSTFKVAQKVIKALHNVPMRCRIPKVLTKNRQHWCKSCR